ncbi:GFA family protein [Acinetobacter sp. ANC 3926]|uniref:GFA family protein n=1 Tax=Acinetobacter genomosp. 15BJ TaxID=106651 RepID=UPI001F4B373C|nr:GFA family protein [Acinetobacter genomosp. 15BJ]MCH7291570.1 GFA family protein [Acinetobacter genomosp. 15BJ]
MRANHQKIQFTGACLCGAVSFQFQLENIKMMYRCYCSLCRKQSGAASNASTFVQAESFQWLQGESLIQTYIKDTGFNSSFCRQCGSPVPNVLAIDAKVMWIPLGLLQEEFSPELELNFCVNAKVSWAETHQKLTEFDELPNMIELKNYFEINQ